MLAATVAAAVVFSSVYEALLKYSLYRAPANRVMIVPFVEIAIWIFLLGVY
jgi:hypothetical protein